MNASSWLKKCEAVTRWFRRVPTLDLVPLLMVTLLLVTTPVANWLREPLLVLLAAGVAFRPALRSPAYWLAIAACCGTTLLYTWESADNHRYLIFYACIAFAAVFRLPRHIQSSALRFNARLLIGFCMLLAVIWKAINVDYIDGTFFHLTLLTDSRFQHFASWLGNLPLDALVANRELVDMVTNGYLRQVDVAHVVLVDSWQLHTIAFFLTWWTVFIEGALGVLFLLPDKPRIAWARNSLLILFAVTTYSVATVRGFGWTLMVLGIAQCRRQERGFRLAYMVGFLLIQLYVLPWESMVRGLSGWFSQ